jgi:hypothetical protein
VQSEDTAPLIRPERHWLSAAASALSLVLPLGVTLWRASVFTQWRDDLPVVRALGLVPIGGEGTVSSVLMQLFCFLPVGGRLLRAALVSALALAVASRLVYALAERFLERNAFTPRLAPPLALAAALTTTLAPTWQLEGTIAGGATLAAALVLAGILLRPRVDHHDARVWLGFGALLGVTTLESHAAGAALAFALAIQVFAVGEFPERRKVLLAFAGAVVVLAVGLAPMVLRPYAGRAWVSLGATLSSASVAAIDRAAERTGVLTIWFREVGLIASILALAGLCWGLLRTRTRWIVAPAAALVVADVVFPASRSGVLSADPLAPVRLCAVAALACSAALAVQTAAIGLQHAKLPMARYAAALLVIFDFTLVLVTAEDSAYPADRRTQNAAEVWTDEALGGLPPRSLLLVRSQAVAWRLWASRVTRGERPDVIVVPLGLLGRGSVAKHLIALEPGLTALIRDVAVSGQPSELSLSTLADSRPLYVELDPSWDKRLIDHLIPKPFWLRFEPHPYGRSDRTAALEKGKRPFRRVLSAAQDADHRDCATLAMLGDRAREQAFALAALGDRQSVDELVGDLRAIDPNHPFVRELEARLRRKPKGRLDVSGLLE